MKIFKKLMILLLSLCITGTLSFTAEAAGKEKYTYTVRFFSGVHGTIGGGEEGGEVLVYRNVPYGTRVTFSQSMVSLLDAGGKYYVRGIRESGRDNNTASRNQSMSFEVTEDQDYVVAYGVLGNSVAYTVRYVDAQENELAPSETYYGNIGDQPVVAFLYIDGYLPQAYNLTGVLGENAADNVFTFTYNPVSPEAAEAAAAAAQAATGGADAAGTGTPAADTAAADAAATAAAAEVDGVTPEEIVQVGDEEVPLAEGGEDGGQLMALDDEKTPLSGGDFATLMWNLPIAAKVGILSLLILIGAGGGYLLARKKGKVNNAE